MPPEHIFNIRSLVLVFYLVEVFLDALVTVLGADLEGCHDFHEQIQDRDLVISEHAVANTRGLDLVTELVLHFQYFLHFYLHFLSLKHLLIQSLFELFFFIIAVFFCFLLVENCLQHLLQ